MFRSIAPKKVILFFIISIFKVGHHNVRSHGAAKRYTAHRAANVTPEATTIPAMYLFSGE